VSIKSTFKKLLLNLSNQFILRVFKYFNKTIFFRVHTSTKSTLAVLKIISHSRLCHQNLFGISRDRLASFGLSPQEPGTRTTIISSGAVVIDEESVWRAKGKESKREDYLHITQRSWRRIGIFRSSAVRSLTP